MALFGGGGGEKSAGFSALVDRVKTRAYGGDVELVDLLNQIFVFHSYPFLLT